jgi:glutamine---fructose-6-phosphate transaminase (isomerizing)
VPSLLAAEISAQPSVLARLRESEGSRLLRLGAQLAARRPRGMLIAARGSSDHAAVYAQYLFGVRARLPVALAATGTFTASLFALAHLAMGWSGADEARALAEIPERVQAALAERARAARIASGLAAAEVAYVIGRGFGFPVALEWALKLKEMAGLPAEPYSAADYRHGPIAVAADGVPALLIDAAGPARSDLAALAQQLRARGARVVRCSDDGSGDLLFPAGPEWLAPIPAAVVGQHLALELSLARGRDPDQPPGLTKITRTR